GRYQNVHEQVFTYVREYTADWRRPVTEFPKRNGNASARHPMYARQHSDKYVLALFSTLFSNRQPDWPQAGVPPGMRACAAPTGRALPGGLQAFLERNARPLAVFTLSASASNDAGNFYETGMKAAGEAGMRALLVTSGLAASSHLPETLPSWACRIDYVA